MTGELPPEGAVLLLGPSACDWLTKPIPFRAVIVRPGERAELVVLRGWYLDGRDIREEEVTAVLSGVEVVSQW